MRRKCSLSEWMALIVFWSILTEGNDSKLIEITHSSDNISWIMSNESNGITAEIGDSRLTQNHRSLNIHFFIISLFCPFFSLVCAIFSQFLSFLLVFSQFLPLFLSFSLIFCYFSLFHSKFRKHNPILRKNPFEIQFSQLLIFLRDNVRRPSRLNAIKNYR